MSRPALRFDTEDHIDYTQRFQGAQVLLSGLVVLNPANLAPAERHVVPTIHVNIMYNPSQVAPEGHNLMFTLAPELAVRFEDGTLRWRFSFPALAPARPVTCTQSVTISGHCGGPARNAGVVPTKTTIYYRGFGTR